jgi:hypothetical protein
MGFPPEKNQWAIQEAVLNRNLKTSPKFPAMRYIMVVSKVVEFLGLRPRDTITPHSGYNP